MFGNFDQFLENGATLKLGKDGQPTKRDLQVAIVVVLLEVAHQDGTFSTSEITELVRTMNHAFGMDDAEVGNLMEIAEILRKDRNKVEQFIAAINSHFDAEQKQIILAMLWKLIKADERIQQTEQQCAIKLRTILNLSLEQSLRAVQMADNNEV